MLNKTWFLACSKTNRTWNSPLNEQMLVSWYWRALLSIPRIRNCLEMVVNKLDIGHNGIHHCCAQIIHPNTNERPHKCIFVFCMYLWNTFLCLWRSCSIEIHFLLMINSFYLHSNRHERYQTKEIRSSRVGVVL